MTASPIQTAPVPARIRVAQAGRWLRLTWPDRLDVALDAAALRRACRCAECQALRHARLRPAVDDGLRIERLERYGVAGLNPTFSDGHRRGLYPWAYLRELAEQRSAQEPEADGGR